MNFEEIEDVLDDFIEKQEINDRKVLRIIWDLFYGLKKEYGEHKQ